MKAKLLILLLCFFVSIGLGLGLSIGFGVANTNKPLVLEANNTPVGSFVLQLNLTDDNTASSVSDK